MKKLFSGLALVSVFVAGGMTIGQVMAQDGSANVPHDEMSVNHNESVKGHCGMKGFCGKRGGHGSGENHEAMMGKDVDHQVTNIDNGVVIEATSSDSETVALIQEHHLSKEDGDISKRWGGKLNVERSVENIDNGVRMTMTSDNPDTVEMLQKRSTSGKGMFGGCGRQDSE